MLSAGGTALHVLFSLLAVLVLAGTVLSYTRLSQWWARMWDFPRQQTVAVGLVSAVGLYALRGDSAWEGVLLLALVAATLAQLAVILPYTPLWRKRLVEVADGDKDAAAHLRLLVSNVLQDNRDAEPLLKLIRERQPDCFFALETDPWWRGQLEQLEDDYPHKIEHALPNTYGLVFRSKLPLKGPELRFLLKEDVPSIRTRVRLRDGRLVTLYGVHPEPPSPSESATSLPRDAELVLAGREIAEVEGPVVLMGDLNDVAWSHTSRLFTRTSGMIDPRIGRGMFSTFHAEHRLLRWPLDHFFVSEHFKLRHMERLPYVGSDHFPILIEFDLPARPPNGNEAPEMQGDDREEAERTLREAEEAGVRDQPAGH